ncbi:uncharacterized protein BX664DRAFT_314242 [Halteromyces radiatus]|uniref:uncharacterized protein n=1 Tax=Halteromyces radiatus TaxID=101107 RepID=UPI00221FE12D|nr:uncharacterized protein BX664DRAFT_314242 [Halteromyces radiatus]KAI8088993.1 hypothetical protein BX664DRAFT_314242 [Halteromyces radiatus]
MMGGTCLCIKAKWVTLKSWLVPSSLKLLHRRRRHNKKEYYQQQQQMQERRPSHCTSCSSQPSDLQDEDRQAYSFFKRRSSQSSQMTLTDLQREADKIYDLFLLAMDELNYAGDSQGTFYYVNDRVSAQEAIENFSCASMQLLTKAHDPQFKSQLQAMVRPRLLLLQKKFNALPDEDDPLTHRQSLYCS